MHTQMGSITHHRRHFTHIASYYNILVFSHEICDLLNDFSRNCSVCIRSDSKIQRESVKREAQSGWYGGCRHAVGYWCCWCFVCISHHHHYSRHKTMSITSFYPIIYRPRKYMEMKHTRIFAFEAEDIFIYNVGHSNWIKLLIFIHTFNYIFK